MKTNIETTNPHLETPPSAAPETPRADRPNVNIAHLPKETRDMINIMLSDGLPYHILIEELGEAGQGLKAQNLTDWVEGRYQDYLKHRQDIEHAKTQLEFATDLIRELGDSDPGLIYRACSVVAAHQIFNAIMEYGDEALRESLQVKPGCYFNMLNSLCNLSSTELKRLQQEQSTS